MENAGKVFTAHREPFSPTAQSRITEEDRVRQVIDRSPSSRQIKKTPTLSSNQPTSSSFPLNPQVIFAGKAQALLKPVQKAPSAAERDRTAAVSVLKGTYTFTVHTVHDHA